MKNTFKHYLLKSKDELKLIWDDCVFVFDTNILLNLYRYTDQTKEHLINILNDYKSKIFVTHHSAKEYFKNRIKVISDQELEYTKLLTILQNEVKMPLQNFRRPPHVSKKAFEALSKTLELIEQELNEKKENISNFISSDNTLEVILELFEGKISKEFDHETIIKICKEGDRRYSENIPPGFKDKNKKGIEGYGDLIIWKEIIELSRHLEKNIIFVSDDKKEDWWLKNKGKTISPHPLLLEEFKKETKNDFYLYNAENFMRLASESLNKPISKNALEEMKDVRQIISNMHSNFIYEPGNTLIIVDISDFTNKKDDIIAYYYVRFDNLNHLTDIVYFDLVGKGVSLPSYTYGYEWALVNERTNEIIRNARMITQTEKGKRLNDTRTLIEVNIYEGDRLKAIRLKETESNPKPDFPAIKDYLNQPKEK